MNCFKCGKPGHRVAYYKSNNLTYFNYGGQSHISTQYEKPNKVKYGGKVFVLSGAETIASHNFIRGTCFINSIP